MYCMKCGKQLPDDARFCSACGAEVPKAAPVPEETPAAAAADIPDKTGTKKDISSKKVFLIIGSIMAVIVLFFAAMLLSVNAVEKISAAVPDPAEFFSVEGEDWRLGTPLYDPESPQMTYHTVEDPEKAVEDYVKLLCTGDYNLKLVESFELYENIEGCKMYVLDYVPDSAFIRFVDKHARALPSVEVANRGLQDDGYYRIDVDIRYGGSFIRTGTTCGIDFTHPDEVSAPSAELPSDTPAPAPEETPEVSEPEVSSEPPAPSEPEPAVPVITGPTLPDPGAFLGGMSPREDEPGEISGWEVYYKMDIDDGWTAVQEYIDLLQDPRFKLTMRIPAEDEKWTTLYLYNEVYYFDYTGPEEIVPAQDRYFHKDYQYYSADVFVSVSKNGRDGYTSMTVCYSNDLNVADLGDRASTASRLSPMGSTGGGSSTGSGANYDAKVPCNVCDRTGDCQTCGGDGYLYSSASGKEDRNCYSCSHTGNCSSCSGKGWLS
ncbi:MAG: zinc-ribbon domain-containing protein [Oscillospiraceae bacterium]|nr:zinc-ribbon domain-containing protein [Oscillospiraceae bacterium]